MQPTPFHRRILPVIFAIVFLAVAPVLLFYTSGYRWNPKKGLVERTGTVIIDSTPSGAAISIDGRLSPDKTSVTIQDMSPGLHRFQVDKTGYHSWTKSLDVYPEKVTFANDIWLWKDATSTLLKPTPASAMSISPDSQKLLLLQAATHTQAQIYDLLTDKLTTINFDRPTPLSARSLWSDNSRYVLSGFEPQDQAVWLIDSYANHKPMLMPTAAYRWSGSDLVGNDGTSQLFLRTSDYSLSKLPLASSTLDAAETAEIRHSSGTADLIYISLSEPDRGLVLPQGNWRFQLVAKDHALLKDGNNWLSLVFKKNSPEYHLASGDLPRSITLKKQVNYLLLNDTELWIWNPLVEPELVLRQSDRIVNAAWHREGSNVFFATERAIFALNLDTRDGHIITQLDTFDHLYDFALNSSKLYILGSKNGQSGLWSLDVE